MSTELKIFITIILLIIFVKPNLLYTKWWRKEKKNDTKVN